MSDSERRRRVERLIAIDREGGEPDYFDIEWACPDCGEELFAPWVEHTCACKPDCAPKFQAHCGGPRCCPHLYPKETK
jgi:hypothetical protein